MPPPKKCEVCLTNSQLLLPPLTSEVSNGQFLGVITNSNSFNLWNVDVLLNRKKLLDTEANRDFRNTKNDTLHPTEANLIGVDSQPFEVCEKFEANLQYKARSSKQTVHIFSALSKALATWKASIRDLTWSLE